MPKSDTLRFTMSLLVDVVMFIHRGLWRFLPTAPKQPSPEGVRFRDNGYIALSEERLEELFSADHAPCRMTPSRRQMVRERLQEVGLLRTAPDQTEGTGDSVWRWELSRALLDPPRALAHFTQDRRISTAFHYYLRRNIRERYSIFRASHLVSDFNALTEELSGIAADGSKLEFASCLADKLVVRLERSRNLRNNGRHSDRGHSGMPVRVKDVVGAFIEACLYVGYLSVATARLSTQLALHAIQPEAEYLLSNTFGFPSSIEGLDNLFGGGGIHFGSSRAPLAHGSLNEEMTGVSPGRVTLIRGTFGAGKSSFGLSLLADVASKGGLAWLFPLEQDLAEYRNCLANFCLLPDESALPIITTTAELQTYLDECAGDPCKERGAIVMLPIEKEHLKDVTADVLRAVELTEGTHQLRLFMLDPVNVIGDLEQNTGAEKRATLVESLMRIKSTGTNMLLIAEHSPTTDEAVRSIQNVADTVIDLTSRSTATGYEQRYISIEKSRQQREQRGHHPFSIKPGVGIVIFPSSAAVSARIRPRRSPKLTKPSPFGWQELETILGEDALRPGDVIAVCGPPGSLKGHIAGLFSLGVDTHTSGMWSMKHEQARTLHVTLTESEHKVMVLAHELHEAHRADLPTRRIHKMPNQIVVLENLALGFIQPGRILQVIESALFSPTRTCYFDRVVIDNIVAWERTCPFVREDATFAQTLIELFRRRGITTLITSRQSPGEGEGYQRVFTDLANVLITIQKIQQQGKTELALRVQKTRGMNHKRAMFLLERNGNRLHLSNVGNMLRVGEGGQTKIIDTVLYLHQETKAQEEYNKLIEANAKPRYGRQITNNSRDRTENVRTLHEAPLAAVDELQIMQIDEFQLPKVPGGLANLSDLHDCLRGMSEELKRRVTVGGQIIALPYYQNAGYLLYDSRLIDPRGWSWRELLKQLHKLRSAQLPGLFSYAALADESYNCLFLEILLGLLYERFGTGHHEMAASALSSEDRADEGSLRSLFREACAIFCSLNELGRSTDNQSRGPAIVTRQWFSSIGEFYTSLPSESRAHYKVCNLPQGSTVAGHWYLGVPDYDPAIECAFDLLKHMVSEAEQLERLQRGVGLPTSEALLHSPGRIVLTQEYSIERETLLEALCNPFCRSEMPNYRTLSRPMAFCLKQLARPRPGENVDAIVENLHWAAVSSLGVAENRMKKTAKE